MSTIANPVLKPSAESRMTKLPWISVAWFLGLLIISYGPVLARLVRQWENSIERWSTSLWFTQHFSGELKHSSPMKSSQLLAFSRRSQCRLPAPLV